jgi:hypothetical protein
MYYKEREEDNTYARPVEGLKLVVDLLKQYVTCVCVCVSVRSPSLPPSLPAFLPSLLSSCPSLFF